MPATPLRRFTTALVLGTAALAAHAQTAPPIKPGLWQIRSERVVNGEKQPNPLDRLRNMTPEDRARTLSAMRARGYGIGPDGTHQVCHTAESLAQGAWRGNDERCKTEITSRSNAFWKWHSVCADPAFELDGQALFASPESYSIESRTRVSQEDKATTMQLTVSARWIGSDCSSLAPPGAASVGK